MSKYETSAGYVSRADTYAKILDLLHQTEDQCYVMAHLLALQDDHRNDLLAQGWRAIGQMQKQVAFQVTKLAQGKHLL